MNCVIKCEESINWRSIKHTEGKCNLQNILNNNAPSIENAIFLCAFPKYTVTLKKCVCLVTEHYNDIIIKTSWKPCIIWYFCRNLLFGLVLYIWTYSIKSNNYLLFCNPPTQLYIVINWFKVLEGIKGCPNLTVSQRIQQLNSLIYKGHLPRFPILLK